MHDSWAGDDHKEEVEHNFVNVYGPVIKRLMGKDGEHMGGLALHFREGCREKLLRGEVFHHSMLFITSGRELFEQHNMVPAVVFQLECVMRMDMAGIHSPPPVLICVAACELHCDAVRISDPGVCVPQQCGAS